MGETLTEELQTLDKEEVRWILQINVLVNVPGSEDEDNNIIINVLGRHNNWRKSVITLAWCRRYCANLKHKVKENKDTMTTRSQGRALRNVSTKTKVKTKFNYGKFMLHPKEVTATESLLFQYAQKRQFALEIGLLSEGTEIQH